MPQTRRYSTKSVGLSLIGGVLQNFIYPRYYLHSPLAAVCILRNACCNKVYQRPGQIKQRFIRAITRSDHKYGDANSCSLLTQDSGLTQDMPPPRTLLARDMVSSAASSPMLPPTATPPSHVLESVTVSTHCYTQTQLILLSDYSSTS